MSCKGIGLPNLQGVQQAGQVHDRREDQGLLRRRPHSGVEEDTVERTPHHHCRHTRQDTRPTQEEVPQAQQSQVLRTRRV